VTIGFALVDDEAVWLLADDDEVNKLLADEDGWSTAIAPAPVVTLEDMTVEDDLALTTPRVRVILGDAELEVETAALDCTAETLDETFEEELATCDDELFKTDEETWPRVAVMDGLVLELLMLEDETLLDVLESFAEDDTEAFDEDFTVLEVVLTVDALVLDVLVAELKIHLHALDTWDADRPGTGELVLVSAAHHLQKGVVWVISSCTAATSLLTQTSFVLAILLAVADLLVVAFLLLVVAALFEIFAVLFLLVVDVETIFAPLTTVWEDALVDEAWLTTHLQTLVREPAARSGRGDVLRLMTSQNSQNAWPYLTSPLNVLRSVAEQADAISN
jgi:hypothetical protein